jgi:hypothetical protein
MRIVKIAILMPLVLGLASVACADSFTLVDNFNGQTALGLVPPLGGVSGTITSIQVTIAGEISAGALADAGAAYSATITQAFSGPITFTSSPTFDFSGTGTGALTTLTSDYSYSFTVTSGPASVTSSGATTGPGSALATLTGLTLGGLEDIGVSLSSESGALVGFLGDSGSITEVVTYTPQGGSGSGGSGTTVPEPSSFLLLGAGLLALAVLQRCSLARE